MQTWILLLRGINVGGNNLVPMKDLRALLEGEGFHEPKTLLQSGNAVFKASERNPVQLEDRLAKRFAAVFGRDVEMFVRAAEDLAQVIEQNPFPAEGERDPGHLLVFFLRSPCIAAEVQALERQNPGPERLTGAGRELYIYYPDGVGTSKLKLPWLGTARNWNTVLKLAALAGVR